MRLACNVAFVWPGRRQAGARIACCVQPVAVDAGTSLAISPAPPSPSSCYCSRGVELGYADLKSLIIGSVDKVADGADKVITGGRLNVTAAMLGLEAMLTSRGVGPAITPQLIVSSPPPPPPPPPPSPVAMPPPMLPAPAYLVMAVAAPVCGMSPLRSLNSATQSSTQGTSRANLAIDGECRKRRVWQGSCSQTREWRACLPACPPACPPCLACLLAQLLAQLPDQLVAQTCWPAKADGSDLHAATGSGTDHPQSSQCPPQHIHPAHPLSHHPTPL